ncbi:hypothetical protein At1g04090-like [Rutidosis leptorrhynchoides]|uniref:hypothetical protein At1g04090-like n=1 Tax=Rutidosis leptorrhynchoides TaxID=125765 RepID=UPI003A9A327B
MNSSPVVTLILFSFIFSFNVATMFNSQDHIHTMFQLPSSLSKWTRDQGGPSDLGITFYDPVLIPRGFSSLGSYAQSNNMPLFTHFHVVKDVSNNPYKPTLKSPTDYVIKWTSHSLNISKSGECYVWFPIAPYGYKAIGYVITREFIKPLLDQVSCVRIDFTDHMSEETSPNDHVMTIAIENQNVIDMNGLHVYSSVGGFKIENERLGKLQGRGKIVNDLMPNLDQIRTLIKAYAPVIYFHPDEEYLPSSVDWICRRTWILDQTLYLD